MSRSVQTMTFMPFASVVEWTWSAPGTRVAGAVLAGAASALAAPHDRSRQVLTTNGSFDMPHLEKRVGNFNGSGCGKEKRRERGKSCAAPRSEHRGRIVRGSF